ncbi:uncharacterized protein AB9W97_010677 [Spinachia spinachia]
MVFAQLPTSFTGPRAVGRGVIGGSATNCTGCQPPPLQPSLKPCSLNISVLADIKQFEAEATFCFFCGLFFLYSSTTSKPFLECEEEELEPWQKHTLLVHLKEEEEARELSADQFCKTDSSSLHTWLACQHTPTAAAFGGVPTFEVHKIRNNADESRKWYESTKEVMSQKCSALIGRDSPTISSAVTAQASDAAPHLPCEVGPHHLNDILL